LPLRGQKASDRLKRGKITRKTMGNKELAKVKEKCAVNRKG